MDAFRDKDVDQARRAGGIVSLDGGRELLLPRVFGFCSGVVHAIAALEHCLSVVPGRRVRLLGPIIHNDTVNEYFRGQGVTILDDDGSAAAVEAGAPDDMVVIPAFGVPAEVEEELRRIYPAGQLIDTTCHDVRAVWEFLESLEAAPWTILIHGKPDHPEIRGTLSRALRRASRVVVVPSLAYADAVCRAVAACSWEGYPEELVQANGALPPASGPVALVTQTTVLYSECMTLGLALTAACVRAGRRCVVADTVCRATQERQDAAVAVCSQRPDLVLVVGGFSSSNTAQLYRLAREWGPAFHVRNAAALAPDRVNHWIPGVGLQCTSPWLPENWSRVGILAGASCPAADVGAVIRWFRALGR